MTAEFCPSDNETETGYVPASSVNAGAIKICHWWVWTVTKVGRFYQVMVTVSPSGSRGCVMSKSILVPTLTFWSISSVPINAGGWLDLTVIVKVKGTVLTPSKSCPDTV